MRDERTRRGRGVEKERAGSWMEQGNLCLMERRRAQKMRKLEWPY